jgi:hypothetical protein
LLLLLLLLVVVVIVKDGKERLRAVLVVVVVVVVGETTTTKALLAVVQNVLRSSKNRERRASANGDSMVRFGPAETHDFVIVIAVVDIFWKIGQSCWTMRTESTAVCSCASLITCAN